MRGERGREGETKMSVVLLEEKLKLSLVFLSVVSSLLALEIPPPPPQTAARIPKSQMLEKFPSPWKRGVFNQDIPSSLCSLLERWGF